MFSGEEKAWETISNLGPADVCKKAGVLYDRDTASYRLKSFGFYFSISPLRREIRNLSEKGEILTKRLSYFFHPSVLSYLVNAKEIVPSGRLMKPENVRGGEFFFKGSHMLPLNKVADKYGNDKEGFIAKGKELSGRLLEFGDASFEFLSLPEMSLYI